MQRHIDVADKTTLDKIYNYLVEGKEVYGFIEHMAVKNPAQRIEYIGANKDYTPMSMNMTTHEMNYGSWGNFPLLLANKPWMVRYDGTPDYELYETDYTKKVDGVTESDVANLEYAGGAYSWLAKIYKEEYVVGTDRVVHFSMSKINDSFLPVGYVDENGDELEGVWLPMFYGFHDESGKMRSISGTQPTATVTTAAQKTAIDNAGARHKFLGGSIVNTITDLLYMFAKNTNSQSAYGLGNCSGYVNDAEKFYGVLENTVVGGGQFYGSNDGKSLNKILHSVVLGSYQQWQRDPYTILDAGRLYTSNNYVYSLSHDRYKDTGIIFKESGKLLYPHLARVVKGFGKVMVEPCGGSTSLGYADGLYLATSGVRVGFRFGHCNNGLIAGLSALFLNCDAAYANWDIGASDLLIPPAGVAA